MEEYKIIKKFKNGISIESGIKTKYATAVSLLEELDNLKKNK